MNLLKEYRCLSKFVLFVSIYILPTNGVTDQSPSPLSNVKSIKKPRNIGQKGVRNPAKIAGSAKIENRQHRRSVYACSYRDYRENRQVQPHFAGSLRTTERRCHARPRNALCPAQRNTAIHPVLLS